MGVDRRYFLGEKNNRSGNILRAFGRKTQKQLHFDFDSGSVPHPTSPTNDWLSTRDIRTPPRIRVLPDGIAAMQDEASGSHRRHKRLSSKDSIAQSAADSSASGNADDDVPAVKAPWRSLFAFTTRRQVPLFMAGVACAILAGAASPAQTLIIGKLYGGFTDYASGRLDKNEFMRKETTYVIYLVAIAAASWLLHTIDFGIWLAFGELQAKSARDRLFHGLLEKEIEWYDMRKNGIGAMLPRLQAQIRDLQLAAAQPMGSIFLSLSTAILSLVQAFVVSWSLTLVTLATVPLIMFLLVLCSNGMQTSINKQQDHLTEAQKYTTNAFASIDTVKCYNGQEIEHKKYTNSIERAAHWYAWVAHASALQMALVVLLSVSMFVQGFYYGGVLIRKGEIGTADVITTFFSAIGAFQAIQGILPQMIVLEKGRTAGATLRVVMAQVLQGPGLQREKGLLVPSSCKGDINVTNLTFAYSQRPDQPALRDVTLYLKGGDLTFLIGRSGSGKSTIGQLLLRFYAASEGEVLLDGTPLESLDTSWLRSNITLVEQTSMLFNDTIFRNIAFGRKDNEKVTRAEVMEAAEFALLQLMIGEMPDGLDTAVGFKGGSMSGGQRQRMALARARLRDTPVLILDESTSALDQISRTLMMDAIRRWRKGKTTIIITHDIGQIQDDDYMYILEEGRVVQEGHRSQLQKLKGTPFQGFLNVDDHTETAASITKTVSFDSQPSRASSSSLESFSDFGVSNSFFDPLDAALRAGEKNAANRSSYLPSVLQEGSPVPGMLRRKGDTSAAPWIRMGLTPEMPVATKPRRESHLERPESLGEVPTTPPDSKRWTAAMEKLVDQTGTFAANARRRSMGINRTRRPIDQKDHNDDDSPAGPRAALAALEANDVADETERKITLVEIFRTLWPSLNLREKAWLVIGFWCATIHAVCSPTFAFVISKLLSTYTMPGGGKSKSLLYSMIVLAIAFVDGFHVYMYRMVLECISQAWVDYVRAEAFGRILDQEREFFEKQENGTSRLTESLDRNAEEMRNLVGRFAAMVWIASLMVIVTIIWALVAQWKLTLAALAICPYIWGTLRLFAAVSEKWEHRCNDASEEAGAIFNETFTNIKTVRALTLEPYFLEKYTRVTDSLLRLGMQRAMYCGFLYGLSDSAGEFSTAMIFYVGALIVKSGASVTDVIMVFTLLIFSLTSVGGILAYIPQVGASKDTAIRLLRLSNLPQDSHEHLGDTRIVTIGDIVFDDLDFAYPTRPDALVLRNINLVLHPGTTTAIVGGSGSGKSTISNLLLDLYSTASMPTSRVGDLSFGGRDMEHIYTPSLRALIVSVSQTPTLFAATAGENIAYGLPADSPNNTPESIVYAARQAGIDDFITSLPQGYNTLIGDGGLGLSGGQAQRISIARALVRKPSVLILDEATSALDVESANLIRHTLTDLVQDRSHEMTIIIITHHRDMMEMAERVVVLDQGQIVEEGTFDELLAKQGPLSHLLSGGEWTDNLGRDTRPVRASKRRSGLPVLKQVDWKSNRLKKLAVVHQGKRL
ncbi:related to ABC a-pheromone efflux pump AtrD [Ramularia collo-cygni]|uniref:Related to ABC a-pheromone efflux pump AtrD n=1 Tax=Ramularia collo-cygni TaxID=112498 RepID=A0A2D3V1G4_9PEZI|nr:related to ABC a-pheromone efflux pump AtrD [Ramularia collo-cygni]CZT18507.1 related to ABC a-pheromone efflux pump AtrD [Ramularia collo-cygni]